MTDETANQPQNILQVEPIQLERFEKMVYRKDYNAAGGELLQILSYIKRGSGFHIYGQMPKIETVFTRLAGAIGSMFADPGFAINFDGFVRLMVEHATLHSIFKVSSFRSMDHILYAVADRPADTPDKISFSNNGVIQKMMVCWSLESQLDIDFDALSKASPEWCSAAIMGYLAIGGVHKEKAYQRKLELMKLRHIIDAVPLPEPLLLAFADVYMHCSYLDTPNKHEIKKILNRKVRELLIALIPFQIVEKERGQMVRKERPTVVVPLEWFGSHHAMYRCYAPSIRQLRKKFNVVGIGRSSELDEASKSEFDRVVLLDTQNVDIRSMLQAIVAQDADIIWYPSLGMTCWWTALSTLRLAPIQVMSPGHPATSHSDAIDYIISDGDLFGDEGNYSETCVHMPVGGARYIQSSALDRLKLADKPDDGVVRLAVPAMVMKLNPPFLAALKRIGEAAAGKVEFNFFPNQIATYNEVIRSDLAEWIPDAVIHPRMEYQDYMHELSKCDLMLSSFPFGGTNSTIDAFLAGVPVLTMEGDQILSRSDASMIRRVGMPERFIVHSVDEYVDSALQLIESPGDIAAASTNLMESDIRGLFYGDGQSEVSDAFLSAMVSIYEREINGKRTAISDTDGRDDFGSQSGRLQPRDEA